MMLRLRHSILFKSLGLIENEFKSILTASAKSSILLLLLLCGSSGSGLVNSKLRLWVLTIWPVCLACQLSRNLGITRSNQRAQSHGLPLRLTLCM